MIGLTFCIFLFEDRILRIKRTITLRAVECFIAWLCCRTVFDNLVVEEIMYRNDVPLLESDFNILNMPWLISKICEGDICVTK